MECKTELFKRSLSWLDTCKSNKIYPKLALFYTRNFAGVHNFYADIITSESYHLTACLAENVDDSLEFSMVIDKLAPILSTISDETFEIIQRPNNIVVRSSSGSHKLVLFGGAGSIPFAPHPEGDVEKSTQLNYKSIKDVVKSYLVTLKNEDNFYDYVYLKSDVMSANPQIIRRKSIRFNPLYPLMITKEVHSLFEKMTSWGGSLLDLDFYENMVVVHNDYLKITMIRDTKRDKLYEDNILSFPLTPDLTTSFILNKERLVEIYKASKGVLKQNNNFVTFDIANDKVIIEGDDHLEFNHEFKANGNFTIKVVYFPYIIEALTFQSGDITVSSQEDTEGFLYYNLMSENVVSTTVKV